MTGPGRGGAPQIPPNCDLTLGLVCVDKSTPGRSVWRMVAHERFANPSGVVQGGFLAALCDSAMGAAAVTHAAGRPVWVANAEMKMSFLRPVPVGAVLTCEAVVVSGGARVAFVEATVATVATVGEATVGEATVGEADTGTQVAPAGLAAPAGSQGEGAGGGRVVARASSTFLYTDRT